MVKTKWGYHSKAGYKFGFPMVGPSLDRFIKKRAIKNILFMPKQSRLAEEKVRSGYRTI
jgi:hypothetical protein